MLLRWKEQAKESAHRDLERGSVEPDVAAIYEAPGLDEIRRVAFLFNRPSLHDVRLGLGRIAPYAYEGTPRHRHAVLEAIARLATYVRTPIPDEALFELLSQLLAALPSRDDPRELALKSLRLGVEALSHVAYDLTLYRRHGAGIIECTRTLSHCIWIADSLRDGTARELVLRELHDLEATALRARPPFVDAAAWFRFHFSNPGPQADDLPSELVQVEARLLEIDAKATAT